MSSDLIDEWDEIFLGEAIKELSRVEEEAMTSSSSRNPPIVLDRPPPDPAPPSTSRPLQEPFVFRPRDLVPWEPDPIPSSSFGFHGGGAQPISHHVSFSPPRELSQRLLEKPQTSLASGDCKIGVAPLVMRNGGGQGRRGGGSKKEKETVESLKRELGRVSKHLTDMEHRCLELQKDGAKKDEELKCAFSQIEAKDAEINNLKRANFGREASEQDQLRFSLEKQYKGVTSDPAGHCPIVEERFTWVSQTMERTTKGPDGTPKLATEPTGEIPEIPLESRIFKAHAPKRIAVQTDGHSAVSELKHHIVIDDRATTSTGNAVQIIAFPKKDIPSKCRKTIGIQTEVLRDCCDSGITHMLSTEQDILRKLHAIWGFPSEKISGQCLIPKLLDTCSADLYALFRCMGMPSQINLEHCVNQRFADVALHNGMQPLQSNYAAKVSQLYEELMKMRSEMASWQVLLGALLDLCSLDNVVIAHRSLRILHAFLQQMSCGSTSDRRNSVLVDVTQSNSLPKDRNIAHEHQILKSHGFDKAVQGNETSSYSSSSMTSFGLEIMYKNGEWSSSNNVFLCFEILVNLFETMRQIAASKTEECIQIEALSIMELILMGSKPNSERERFGLMPLLESLSRLLRKEVSSQVQKHVVHVLFLLLNCPKLLMMFCDEHRDYVEQAKTTCGQITASALQGGINCILEGLAGCLAFARGGTQEQKLRKHVITMLAFIASSGKTGFDVLLHSVNPQGVNFLEIIVQVLESELDSETAEAASQNFCKERISLMREALILLNRLASHPTYSKATLGVLTSSNTTASLTIDVANRMSRKSGICRKHGDAKQAQLLGEIVDLAQLFKARVFCFLDLKDC